jgi:hypothetical protein
MASSPLSKAGLKLLRVNSTTAALNLVLSIMLNLG